VNFIQTSHLGLRVPAGDCWMKVGEHTRPWAPGKALTCDTSFFHETWNGTPEPRYVLIMRHWHPEVTPTERVALQFLFDAADSGLRVARTLAAKRLSKSGAGAQPAAAAAPAAAAPKAAGGGKGGKKK
jgi:aspartate beta-hydroxylase